MSTPSLLLAQPSSGQLARDVKWDWRAEVTHAVAALAGVGGVTAGYVVWVPAAKPTTVALSYLLLVLFVAAASRRWVAVMTSVAAALSLDFFFLPPPGTLNISDPQDWVAFSAFVTVSLVASHLSSIARTREHELGRLFDFSRDVLLDTGSAEAIRSLGDRILGRFGLNYVAICLPAGANFDRHEAGVLDAAALPDLADLRRVMRDAAGAPGTLKPAHPAARTPGVLANGERDRVRLVPLQHHTRVIGVLALAGRPIESSTLNPLASLIAIAIERVQLLEQRRQAEISRRSVELRSNLLASLAHDLRTPLTAVRLAVKNLDAPHLTDDQRSGQVDVAVAGIDRLTRLFQNILELTRIDAGDIAPSPRWVHPSEVISAARRQAEQALHAHIVTIVARSTNYLVHIDPQLTAVALAHLLENAAQYSAPGTTITITHDLTPEGLLLAVDDQGAGVAEGDVPRLFERFYRGGEAHLHVAGTGMGLAVTRGLVGAEGGRVWVANRTEGGARFSILVPAESRVSVDD
jgi:two-component system sensor histidine kinase KdpD